MSRLARHHPDDPDAWDTPPLHPPAEVCRCRHLKTDHITRHGRVLCGSVCGCASYRPLEKTS